MGVYPSATFLLTPAEMQRLVGVRLPLARRQLLKDVFLNGSSKFNLPECSKLTIACTCLSLTEPRYVSSHLCGKFL